ncbi:MAG: mercury methylation corrinoid protein HgcA [candidate division Zixibacteria bacterium]
MSELLKTVQPCDCNSGCDNLSYITGYAETSVGDIPVVSTTLDRSDKRDAFKARWDMGRMDLKVTPGLYAVGNPDDKSNIFVTANYKLSFDHLRKSLVSLDCWILVLNTFGVNVWCAAGKGTFGTDELLKQIESTKLAEIVSHRKLILPQLGAPGVAAHEVKDKSGFKVIYGPVRSADIPAYLENGKKATPEMRRVRFPFADRIQLIPVEMLAALKHLKWPALVFILASGLNSSGYSTSLAISNGLISVGLLIAAIIAGAVLMPAMLPYLPGRAFSTKGGFIGLAVAVLTLLSVESLSGTNFGYFKLAAWTLIIPAIASFMAMNFTGSSTYTSLSGVLKEMKRAVPIQIGATVIGLGLWITGLFLTTGNSIRTLIGGI